MYSFFINLVSFCLICGQSHRQENDPQQNRVIKPLSESLKQHLEADPLTNTILTSVYELGFSDEIKNLLHLSLNNLLVTSSLFASSDLANYADKFIMNQDPDTIQKEVDARLIHL